MRAELENIKRIEDYLLGKLDAEATTKFENEISTNDELAKQVELQKILMQRVKIHATKQSIARAHRRYKAKHGFSFRNPKFTALAILALATIGLSVMYFFQTESGQGYIQPPFEDIDVPFIVDTVDATNSQVINYETGSMVLLPDSAFVNKNGKLVTGKIKIHFREFKDAIDIFISGIPMEYEIAGKKHPFESAAMCEVFATQNGERIQLRDGKEMEIVQASYTNSPAFSLYKFDKNTGKWKNKGKDIPMDFLSLYRRKRKTVTQKTKLPPEPIRPQKASSERISFMINYNPRSFPELSDFKGVLFEVDESITKQEDVDCQTLWEDVQITKGPKEGTFWLKFRKPSTGQKGNYAAYPVFKGKQYDDAKKLYAKKLKAYNRKYKNRIGKEEKFAKQIARKKRKLARYNRALGKRLVKTRNKAIEDSIRTANQRREELANTKQAKELNTKRMLVLQSPAVSKKIKRKLVFDRISVKKLLGAKNTIERAYARLEAQLTTQRALLQTLRTYQVESFGIYNCDTPAVWPKGMTVFGKFISANETFYGTSLIDRQRRSVFKLPVRGGFSFNPKSENLILKSHKRQLYFFDEFSKIPASHNGKTYEFRMKEAGTPVNSYSELRELTSRL